MKSKTPELLKFKRLCRRLKEPSRGVVGLLELLWLGTAKNCPCGDIGRFDNTDIAILCGWEDERDPDELIDALVAEGWLDESAEHRLVVHDWHEHAPSWLSMNLRRTGESFAGVPTDDDSAEAAADATAEASAERSAEATTLPSPPIPLPSPPPPPASGDAADADWAEVEGALRSVKVARVRATLDEARRRDLTPADAMRLVTEYRAKPGAWQPGALVRMLTGELAEWPPAAEAHQRPQRAAERVRLVEEQVVRRDRNAAERLSNRAQDAALRRRWAELPDDERVRLLDLRQPNWRQLRRKASAATFAAVLAEPPPERTRASSRRPQAVA